MAMGNEVCSTWDLSRPAPQPYSAAERVEPQGGRGFLGHQLGGIITPRHFSLPVFTPRTERVHFVEDEMRLLAGVRQLDERALAEVHDTYYPAIFRYIAFRVGDQLTAEDLASEVFARLLTAVRDQNAPQNTLRGWLYKVASYVVADHHRRQYRAEKAAVALTIENDPIDPSETVSKRQTIDELYTAMADLTKEQQDVIALRFGSNMAIRDVAQTMGKSEGAVKQLQARAIAALSKKLGPRRS